MIRENYPLEDIADYDGGGRGGGGGGRTSITQVFFYLVIRGDREASALSSQEVQQFFRMGTNSKEGFVFTLVDIARDDRLKTDILGMEDGASFYERLEGNVPAFLVTYAPVREIRGTSVIKLHPISDYAKDVNALYVYMGMLPLSARKAFAAFLRQMNRYLQLKPNIAGFGFNLNDVIDDWANYLERTAV